MDKRPGSLQQRSLEGTGIGPYTLTWAPCTLSPLSFRKKVSNNTKKAISKSIRPSGPGMEATGQCLPGGLLEISLPLCQASPGFYL